MPQKCAKKQDSCRIWKDDLEEGTELYARAEQAFVTFVEAALTLKSQPTIDAIPVEWLREKMLRPQMTEGNPFGFVLAEWLEEQEAR